jgi:hypothetical protein
VKRGDVVAVAAAGDYVKPRPAVIVQTNALPTKHASHSFIATDSDEVSIPLDSSVLIVAHISRAVMRRVARHVMHAAAL